MRIAVLCNDTAGGVLPYAALAAGLMQAGHKVTALAPALHAQMFTAVGVPVASLAGTEAADLHGTTDVAEAGTMAAMRMMTRVLPTRIAAWSEDALAACSRTDLVLGGVGGMVIGRGVAAHLGLPFQAAHLQPLGLRSRSFPGVLFARTPGWGDGLLFPASQALTDAVLWLPFRKAMAQIRAQYPPRPSAKTVQPTALYGFSPHVIGLGDINGGRVLATGYWQRRTPKDWEPPPGLAAFLAADRPVISIGFGSMGSTRTGPLLALVTAALRQVGARGVILSGAARLRPTEPDPDLFEVGSVPHDWLFPKVDAVVHHGGAGTTGAVWTAGVPAVVVPFAVDQPFWGLRAVQLGVGPAPIPRRQLTVERLAHALHCCLDDVVMRHRAKLLGETLRAESGVAKAVDYITLGTVG